MGFWGKIGGFFKRLIGGKPKEDVDIKKIKVEDKIKEVKRPEGVDKIIGEPNERYLPEMPKTPEQKQRLLEEVKKEEEIKNIEKFKERNRQTKSRFRLITESTKRDWETKLNERRLVISTGVYKSYESLLNNKYTIYRDIIMGAIKGDDEKSKKLVQDIYQSGILDEHIVAVLRVLIKSRRADGSYGIGEIQYEIQGLTPDKAINYNVHNEIMGFRGGDSNDLRMHINRICNTEVYERSTRGGSHIEVMGVEISFNYA
jgi:hypothetical protein